MATHTPAMPDTSVQQVSPDGDGGALQATVRGFLDRNVDPDALFRQTAGEPDWDPVLWSRCAAELGTVGLDLPDRDGGAGASFREVAIVAHEMGRSLVRLPWLSTAVLGVGTLEQAEGPGAAEIRAELLPGLLSGRCTATFAHQERPDSPRSDRPATTAERDGARWVLHGTKTLVVEGATADLLFVSATTTQGLGLFVVRAGAPGLVRTPLRVMDPNRQLAAVTLDGTPAEPVGDPDAAEHVVTRVLDRAAVAWACEQTGGACAALDMAVGYTADRLQFGRPIATFQAVKHRCADMLVEVEAALSASWWAAAVAAESPERLPVAASAALLRCSAAYRYVAAENVQLHGGIGFTWEHRAHLHFRRAETSAVLFGSRLQHQERLLEGIGL